MSSLDAPVQDRTRFDPAGLLAFTEATHHRYQTNWHHEVLCDFLSLWIKREIRRLMVFMPPRRGKSELVSRRLPAYIFGLDPDSEVVAASYGADLARSMNRDVQRIIDSPEYKSMFPETRLFGSNIRTIADGSYLRNSDEFEIVGRKGRYKCAGVGGGLTGRGFQYGIIDDPIKDREEAASQLIRDKVYDWYTNVFYTRQAPDACILLTMTRWHEDDLAGRLLEAAKQGGDQWSVISFPEIKESDACEYDKRELGDVLWPGRYPFEEAEKTRVAVGSKTWASLYQQRPAPEEGGILKRHWWRYWKPKGIDVPPVTVKLPNGEYLNIEAVELPDSFDTQIQSWDMAFKDEKASKSGKPDFVVGQVWGKKDANKFLLDQLRDRVDFVATCEAVKILTDKYPKATAKLVEDKANGPAVIATLKGKITGLIAVEPEGGKVSRVNAVAPEIEAGNVYLPHPHVANWVNDFIESSAAFPNAANDDEQDAMSQALLRLSEAKKIPVVGAPSDMTRVSTWASS